MYKYDISYTSLCTPLEPVSRSWKENYFMRIVSNFDLTLFSLVSPPPPPWATLPLSCSPFECLLFNDKFALIFFFSIEKLLCHWQASYSVGFFSQKHVSIVKIFLYQLRLYIFTSMVFSNIWWDLAELWMRSIRVGRWDLAEWLENLTANTVIATVLGSFLASSDTVESEGRQMKQCWIL